MLVMNLEQLHKKLLAAARANPPTDRVPYAFEKRIMARIALTPAVDAWALWGRALWRAAAPCVVLAVALGAASFLRTEQHPSPSNAATVETVDLSQHFENTLLAGVNDSAEETW
jgi:hypothetical protein